MVIFTTSTCSPRLTPRIRLMPPDEDSWVFYCSRVKAAEVNCMKTHVYTQMDALLQLQCMYSLLRCATDSASFLELCMFRAFCLFNRRRFSGESRELFPQSQLTAVITRSGDDPEYQRCSYWRYFFSSQLGWTGCLIESCESCWRVHKWVDGQLRVCGFHLCFWSFPSPQYLISHPDEIIFLLVLHCFVGVLEPTEACCDWRVDFLLKSHHVAPGLILTVNIYLLTDWCIWDKSFCITTRTVYIWGVFSNVNYFCRKLKNLLLWTMVTWLRVHRCVFDVLQQVLEERLSVTTLRTSQTAGRGFHRNRKAGLEKLKHCYSYINVS